MTIEERDTARAIQTIARGMKKPAQPAPIDWERERYELAKEIFVKRLTLPDERLSLTEEGDAEIAIDLADTFIETYKRSQTNKPE